MSMVILSIVILTILVGLGYWIFYQREKKQLNRLQKMVDQAATGSLNRTEISEEKYSALENSLKRYLDDSLLAGQNQQKQKDMVQGLISDISHQTLTPISNLKIYTEILREQSEEGSELIDTILGETEKLEFLIQSLVKLSRMENGIISVHPIQNAIASLLAGVRQQYETRAGEKNISLKVDATDLQARYDLKWTSEALGNIVDNAIKYTEQGRAVTITVEQYSFFIRIDIADDGIGIREEEIPKIFTRFYRSFAVSGQPGVGIGLYLAREIIQAQKGYIKVASKIGKGSTFSVFLPI